VVSKVATNAFRCRSIIDGGTSVLPGDVLIKVAALNEGELRRLVLEMEALATRNATLASMDDAAENGQPRRRSARLRLRQTPVEAPSLAALFAPN